MKSQEETAKEKKKWKPNKRVKGKSRAGMDLVKEREERQTKGRTILVLAKKE